MKLLYVAPAYPPMMGGTESLVHALAEQAAAAGHQVTIVTSDIRREQGFWERRSRHPNQPLVAQEGPIRVIRCPAAGFPGGRAGLFLWRKAMVALDALPGNHPDLLGTMARYFPNLSGLEQALAQSGEHDLVHAFDLSWEYPALASWRYARARDIPFILQPNLHLGISRRFGPLRNNTMSHQQRLLRDADALIANTCLERKALLALQVVPERVHVVGIGFTPANPLPDAQQATRILAPFGLSDPIVLFIGRVCRDKGAIHAVEAVMRLAQRLTPSPMLVLAGAISPDFARYYRRLPAEARQWVRPLGMVSEEVKQALLHQARLLVLPSRMDSFGIVILEAWTYGKPVIGARAGGIPGVIEDGVDGLLVNWGRPDQLANAIARLLNDPETAARMGAQGRTKWLQKYTWQRVYACQERIYRQIIQAYTGN